MGGAFRLGKLPLGQRAARLATKTMRAAALAGQRLLESSHPAAAVAPKRCCRRRMQLSVLRHRGQAAGLAVAPRPCQELLLLRQGEPAWEEQVLGLALHHGRGQSEQASPQEPPVQVGRQLRERSAARTLLQALAAAQLP